MKKYNFLIYYKDYKHILLKLRELGVVHIVQKQLGTIQEDSELARNLSIEKRLHNVVEQLNFISIEHHIKEHDTQIDKNADANLLLEYVESLFAEKDKLQLEKEHIQREIDKITPLGEFEPEDIHRLERKGLFIHLHEVTESKFETQWIEDYYAVKLGMNGSLLYFATITKDPIPPPIEADDMRLPDKSILNWKIDLINCEKARKDIENELNNTAKDKIETLRYFEKRVNDEIAFEKVELSGDTAAEEKLLILEGYVPEENEPETTNILKNEALYFNVSTPQPKDNPPVKLQNNRFAKAFELIANLYDKPNYHAFDLTPFFAPFYVIFFGLCMGDCGYGLLLLLLSVFIKRSKQGFIQTAGQLGIYLSIGAIVFGFISGTFFGIQIPELSFSWLNPLKTFILDEKKLFFFALIVGGVQIIYAIIIKAITQWLRFGFSYSLDAFGWLLLLLGNGALLLPDINSKLYPSSLALLHYFITAVAVGMMLFFNNPVKGIKGIPGSIGTGLFGLYNKLTGILGDFLSYIRLFALGISGSVMGLVFNELAQGFAPDIVVLRELVMIVILLFGHGLNMFINGLGSLIHPMRLTFVEFYKNAGFEGGGKPYTPFVRTAR
jgi:V/A-type H+-transporting ATPase subunit I